MSLSLPLPDERIQALGRISHRDGAYAFDWTNSGIYFRFRGNKVTFRFDAPALSQNLYVKIKLDNRSSRVLVNGDNTDIVIHAAQDAEHSVYLVRCNEVLDAVPLVLRDITIDGDSPAVPDTPLLPERKMLFIGDSITCGFGNLSDGNLPRFVTSEQDGTKTFAALTAEQFGAQAHFVCISGRGIARNCDNFDAPLIPQFFDQTMISDPTPWDHTQYQPDVIVINGGTNDTAGEVDPVDPEVFKKALCDFATHLMTVYPNARLIWCYGMMSLDLQSQIEEAVKTLPADRVETLFFTPVSAMPDEFGACTHPNLRAHYRCAGVLIDKIHRFVGWER